MPGHLLPLLAQTYPVGSPGGVSPVQQVSDVAHTIRAVLHSSYCGRLLEKKYELANTKIRDQIESNNVLLDKLKVIKNKVGGNKKTVLDIPNLINLIENPNGDVESVIRSDTYYSEEYSDTNIDSNNGGGEKEEKEEEEGDIDVDVKDIPKLPHNSVIPVLLFSCNRVAVSRALDLLITHRPSKEQFPIIVSQDCDHQETRWVTVAVSSIKY